MHEVSTVSDEYLWIEFEFWGSLKVESWTSLDLHLVQSWLGTRRTWSRWNGRQYQINFKIQ